MLAEINGKILRCEKDKVDLEVGPITLTLFSPAAYIQKLKRGKKAHFFTEFILDEAGMSLFGFQTSLERELFRRLTRIQGVGKRMAFRLLNGHLPILLHAIAEGDESLLKSVSGVGVKTIRRILSEMKEEVLAEKWGKVGKDWGNLWLDAMEALLSLGFTRREARERLQRIRAEFPSIKSLEELIRKALQQR